MALQPQDRPAGSTQVLRFVGSIAPDVAVETFPKANGSMTTGGAVGSTRGLRFLFADSTNLANQLKRFPEFVYDDSQPGGISPHAPVATTLVAQVVNAGEQSVALRTWAQNMDVDVKGLSANLGGVDTENCFIVLDTLTSGLGLGTGLPVLIVPVTLTGGEVAAVNMDVRIEIRWTAHR